MDVNAIFSRNCGTRERGMSQGPMYSAACKPLMSADVVEPEPVDLCAITTIFAAS